MSWYEFLLFVHVAAAVVWLGGALFIQVYAAAVRRGGDAGEMAAFAGRAGALAEKLFVPSSLLVVLAGIGLMIEGSWSWGQLWVVFALVTFVASFAVGLGVLSPLAKRIPGVGADTAEGQALIVRLFAIMRIDLVFMYAIVFAMTVKPTGDDGWTVAVAAVALAALSVWFLRGLRSAAAPQAVAATD